MTIVKDLLYNNENKHLDIARLSALLSVFSYLGMSIYFVIANGGVEFDFFEWAGGWAALCGGNAAWIYARQRIEMGMDYKPMNPRQQETSYSPYYQGYNYNDEEYTPERR